MVAHLIAMPPSWYDSLMNRRNACRPALLIALLVSTTIAGASDDPDRRAWQQRLEVEIPLPVPSVAVEAANPFASEVDTLPTLRAFETPRRLDVSGRAVAAVYVDAEGDCLGAVPLEVPFPGLSGALTEGLMDARFDPAQQGGRAVASWPVVEIRIEGRIKEAEVVAQNLALPDPTTPPTPSRPPGVRPSSQLLARSFAPAVGLTSLASPRSIRVRASSNESEVSIQALVHITADGRCDRFVPLLMDAGLDRWFSGFLATWKLDPATAGGEAIDSWMIYTGRLRMDMSSLSSESFKVIADRVFDPQSSR
jgi:hypothetical protein